MSEEEIKPEGQEPAPEPETMSVPKSEWEAMQAKLANLENKDLNFKTLREKKLSALSDEEKEEIHKKTLEVVEKSKEIEDKQNKFIELQRKEYIDDALNAIVGEDEKEREKILFHYNRLSDKADTKREIITKVRDAYNLAKSKRESVGDVVANAASTYWGAQPKRQEKRFDEKPEGQDLLERMGIKSPKK
jgi:hypothetical protein